MKPWELDKLRIAAKAKWLGRGTRSFNGHVCTDSRKAAEGDLFIAIAGKNHDAHDFLVDVVARNVAVILVHKELPAPILADAQHHGCAILQVEDTIAGLNRLAAVYRNELRAKVIAVGGSNGKTTTKRIIHTLLSEKLSGHSSPKSFNNNIGMPLTLLEVESKHEFVVLEIGTNAPGEIAALGDVCRPDIAVITSVGLEHLEKLGDLEGVAKEEASIAAFVTAGGMLILPAHAPELAASLKTSPAQKVWVGADNSAVANQNSDVQADLVATNISESIEGTSFTINGRGGFRVPLLGSHNAVNALMAIAVARRLGLSDDQIAAGLLKVKPVEMRLEPMTVGGFKIINDAYNANPSSMEAAIKTFAHLKSAASSGQNKPRKVAILGDMLELGVSTEAMHRAIGGLVAGWKLDLFIAIGPQMRFAADVASVAGVPTQRFADTASARTRIQELLLPGDEILLKGSRGMALETLLGALHNQPEAIIATH